MEFSSPLGVIYISIPEWLTLNAIWDVVFVPSRGHLYLNTAPSPHDNPGANVFVPSRGHLYLNEEVMRRLVEKQ